MATNRKKIFEFVKKKGFKMDLEEKYKRFKEIIEEINEGFVKSSPILTNNIDLNFNLLEDSILKNDKEYFIYAIHYLKNIVEISIELLCKKFDLDNQYLINNIYDTYKIKNERYDDSFSKTVKKYGFNTILIRLSDKIGRYNTLLNNLKLDNQDDESIIDTLKDLTAYSIMSIIELENCE